MSNSTSSEVGDSPVEPSQVVQAAIIHNHPIHYKHLLFNELSRQGLIFEVLFTAESSAHRIEPTNLAQSSYRYSIGFHGRYEKVPLGGTIRFVWKTLNRLAPQVVIIGGYSDVAAWTAWLWGRIHGAPRIIWAESNVFDRPRHALKELPKRWFLSGCAVAHVYGLSSKAYLCSLGMPPDKVFVGRALCDVDHFLPDRVGPHQMPECKVMLYVGRFSQEKNLPFLVCAFARVPQDPKQPRLRLALVGYGPMEHKLRKLADDLGASRTVEFWGSAGQNELPLLYRRADALILPSSSETWGLVVNEAMLCGLPVLVSDRCGCAADLVTTDTGWTFSPFDESALTRLLNRVALLPRADLEAMGICARKRAENYSPENCACIVRRTVDFALSASGGAS